MQHEEQEARELLKLDYQQTAEYFRELAGSRFKLLAIVPALTGAALGVLDPQTTPTKTAIVGLFGFLVTLGIAFYDQRNTQIYDAMQIRAKNLEAYLGLPRGSNQRFCRGGAFLDRPPRSLKLFGLFDIWHDRGLAIVYSTSLAAWAYIFVAGALVATGATGLLLRSLRYVVPVEYVVPVGYVIPVAVWIAFMIQFHLADLATDQQGVLSEKARNLLKKPPEPPLNDA